MKTSSFSSAFNCKIELSHLLFSLTINETNHGPGNLVVKTSASGAGGGRFEFLQGSVLTRPNDEPPAVVSDCLHAAARCLAYKYRIQEVNTFKIKEPWHDKTNKISVHPAKTQISLNIRPVWSEYWLFAWRKLGSLAAHWAHSEDSGQTGMPRLIWVFAGRTVILLLLSCHGSKVSHKSDMAGLFKRGDTIKINERFTLLPAPVAQSVECLLRWTRGHGFDPGPRHTEVVNNGTSCSSIGLVNPVSG